MRRHIGFSEKTDRQAALNEACAAIEGQPVFVVFFAGEDDFEWYAQALAARFPASQTIGATTYIGFSSVGWAKRSLALLAVMDGIECASGVLLDIKRYPMKHRAAIESALAKLSGRDNCCCLELVTAFGQCEEIVLDTFRVVLEETGIPVFGGSSGSSGGSTRTLTALNGAVYDEACVFLLLRNLNGPIRIYRENIYRPTEHIFTATDVDCEDRIVYEFNGKPAARVMAKALGVSVAELPRLLPQHPLGRVHGDDFYITECDSILDDGAISYFARIYNGTKMALLEPDDADAVLTQTLARVRAELPEPSFCIVVNCLSRSMLFESTGRFGEFARRLALMGDYVGFSGYGEQISFEHLNQSMLIAAFQ